MAVTLVTLADHHHSGNDPRRMSLRKLMLSFGAIIFASFFINWGNTPNGSTPPYVSRSRSRRRRTEVRKAKEFHLEWGNPDKGVTNCSRHCLLSNWEPRSEVFAAGAAPNHLRAPESWNRLFHTKDRTCKWLPPLMWTGGVLQSIPVALIMRLPCRTINPLGLSTSKHKLTPMFRIACSTPGMISSLFGIISSPASGIKPLHVSRSTTQNSGRNICTNDLTNSSIECMLTDQLTSILCSM